MFIKTLDEISEKQFQDNTKCPQKKKYIFLPKAPPKYMNKTPQPL
jgi:hypothetical protein